MKNDRIVKAYDSINPSIADKQKMLNVILQEAHLEEKPVKARKKRDSIVYTATPAKTSKRSTFMTIAASLALLLVSGFVLARMIGGGDQNPSYVQPTEEQATVTVNVSYIPVLEKYRTALREGWSKEECEIEGISTRFYMPEPVDFTIGKRILDINNDGRAELLIGHDINIWDLYTTLEDGTPIQLLSDVQDGWQYYICENQWILAEYYSKKDCCVEYYRLEGHQLMIEQQMQYRDGQWMIERAEQEWESISEREVQDLTNSIKKLTPDWIPLEDHAQIDADAMERYTPILEKYTTALSENWSEQLYQENDISSQIATYLTAANNPGWCLTDLDENGTNELVIADKDRVYDIYTLNDAGMAEHILTATGPNAFSLYQGGILREQVFFSKGCSWYLSQLSEGKQELLNVLTYRNEYEGTEAAEGYYYGTNEDNGERISKDQAGEILSRYQPMNLQLTPLVDWDFDIFDDEAAYDSLIDVYQQALTEKWDAEKCLQQDISMMISRFQEDPGKINAVYLDMDKDGMNELLITDGMMIYDLYTLTDGGPVHLLTGWERNSYRYCMEDVIFNRASGSAFNTCYRYYRLENGELVVVDSVVFDASVNPDNPWFRSADGETPETPLTEQEATAIMGSYKDLSLLGTSILEID